MHCILVYSYHQCVCVHVCVCVCVCMCVCLCGMPHWWTIGKRLEINLPFLSPFCRIQQPSNDIFGEFVAHDLTYFLKVNDSNRNHFDRLSVVITQTMTDAQILQCQLIGRHLLAFEWCIYIWNWPILKVKFKDMKILWISCKLVTDRTNITIADT